ncbi:hypothetical protein AWQ24_02820 [Picosynechococcus sp. PCC 8807]|nr:hypothetical protein AWQ24_02820 [Picosynechococcus sp. PCC 8807]
MSLACPLPCILRRPMGFQSIDHLLNHLLDQPAWAHQKRFTAVNKRWQKILPKKSLANSHPIRIIDDVLWVATPNHTWSQHLNLQRRRLLAQLNAQLNPPLKDLQFSTVHWHRRPAYSPLAADPNLPHPSQIPPRPDQPQRPDTRQTNQDPLEAARHWAETQQQLFAGLPACPRCQRATPPGELQRWQVCSFCIVQVWQEQQPLGLGLPPESSAPDTSTEPENAPPGDDP